MIPNRGQKEWPSPLGDAALHGLAGDIVNTIAPHTEADPVAILGQFLLALGNEVGRNAYFEVEATQHHLVLFAVLVGETAKARKGTSWNHVSRLFQLCDQRCAQSEMDWNKRIVEGLSSGEGLVWEVRDSDHDDGGVADKRRIVVESEFAATLKICRREGNTLSPVIRKAWDCGELQTLTKHSPARASGAHISIVGHITLDELRRDLSDTEQANGFANRFMWLCVRRANILPDGGKLHERDLLPLASRLCEVIEFVREAGRIERDEEATELWHRVYPSLSNGETGLVGSVIARAEAQVVRISCLYAVLERSTVIRLPHLQAALAFWAYCDESARYIFGGATGDRIADQIMAALSKTRDGLSRTEIRNLFQRNQNKSRIDRALAFLETHGLAIFERKTSSQGRSAEHWYEAKFSAENSVTRRNGR